MSEIAQEVEKLEAFVDPQATVAGLKLRPFTAGSLILLRKTKNGLLDGSQEDVEFDVAAFLYAHTAEPKTVRESARTADAWRDAVLTFADGISVADFVAAAQQIKGILQRASVGQDYDVDQEPDHPN
jgi:hypothetical protein